MAHPFPPALSMRKLSPEELAQYDDVDGTEVNLEPIKRISADLRAAARTLRPQEVRYLVDLYYATQKLRIRSAHQTRIAALSAEPNEFFAWTLSQMEGLERRIKAAMQEFSEAQRPGRWAMSVRGIGPVLTAGLLANVNLTRQTTPSKLWAFAGLDPTRPWLGKEGAADVLRQVLDPTPRGMGRRGGNAEITDDHLAAIARLAHRPYDTVAAMATDEKGQRDRTTLGRGLARRPWSERLKTVTFKVGDCLVKQGSPDEPYRPLYAARKALEWERNLAGELADQARGVLATRNIGHETEAYAWYSGAYAVPQSTVYTGEVPRLPRALPSTDGEGGLEGVPMLPPAHIHMRAQRFMVKIFLVHLWQVCWMCEHPGETAPRAYVHEHLGHQHEIPIPNWPID